MLEVSELSLRIGSRRVVDRANLIVAPGEIVGIIGPNGAGKTSLARGLAGFMRATSGAVNLQLGARKVSLLRKRAAERCRLGIVYLPADRPVFQGLTVRENLSAVHAAFGSRRASFPLSDAVIELGSGFELRAEQLAETLSGGEQRLLSLARAQLLIEIVRSRGLASAGLLILDEPSRGLAPRAVDALAAKLKDFADLGIGILILEQDAPLPTRVADRVHQIELGRLGAPAAPRRSGPQ